MQWILEPISIATQGYASEPAPLAIATHGYVRFKEVGRRGGGHGGAIRLPIKPVDTDTVSGDDAEQLALLAVAIIEETDL